MEDIAEVVETEEVVTEATEEETQDDTQEIEEEVEQEEEADEVEEEAEEPEDDVPAGVKKRIDKVTRDKYDALREAEYWRGVAQQRQQQEQQPPPQQAQPQTNLQPEQFNTYEEYTAAVAQQSALQAVQQYQQQMQQLEQSKRVQANLEKAKEKYEDFESVVGNPSVPTLNPQLQQAVYSSPDFGDIAYHLASNPATVKELNNMNQYEAIMRIGGILTEVKNAVPKKPKAPKPPKKVKAGGEPVHRDPEKLSTEEWVRLRNEGKI